MCDTISRIIRKKTHIFGIVLKENDIIYAKVICLVYFIVEQSTSRYKRQSYHTSVSRLEWKMCASNPYNFFFSFSFFLSLFMVCVFFYIFYHIGTCIVQCFEFQIEQMEKKMAL